MDGIRIGTVSSVNYAAGTVSVAYQDRGDGGTDEMPYFAFGGQYRMPKKDQMVLVLHLANGSSMGVVMGLIWNNQNKPPVSGADAFWMDLAAGAALQAVGGAITLKGSSITLDGGGSITVSKIIEKLKDHEKRISALGG